MALSGSTALASSGRSNPARLRHRGWHFGWGWHKESMLTGGRDNKPGPINPGAVRLRHPAIAAIEMPVSRRALLISLVPAALWLRDAIAADGPTAVIQRFCDALIAVMKEAKGLSFDQRYQRLAPTISQAYNLPLM